MPARPTVRTGRTADVDACVELALAAAAGGQGAPDAGFWRAALGRDVEQPDRLLVVAATDHGEVVGYARAHVFAPDGDQPGDVAPSGHYLMGLFVRTDHRRQGVGAALTETRLAWIAERAGEAWFFTDARNSVSIRMHERFGFDEVTRRFSFPGVETRGSVLFRAGLG